MKTAPISTQNNPGIKMAYHTYKLRMAPADATSPIYKFSVPFFDNGTPKEWIKFRHGLQAVLKGQNVTQGPPSYTVAKTLLKRNALIVSKQAEIDHGMQSMPHFELCLDDVAEHMFPEKARQTQKRYMCRNLRLVGEMTDFPAQNGNKIQPLGKDKIMDILEYGVPALWRREFIVQGFNPVDQGLNFFVEFCNHLESCEPSADKPKDEKPHKPKSTGERKADMPTKPAGEKKFYCDLHKRNKTHDTKDCYKLKQRAKCTKQGKERKDRDK
eukprot:13236104-Ditylum_brightwellii.AAC.1